MLLRRLCPKGRRGFARAAPGHDWAMPKRRGLEEQWRVGEFRAHPVERGLFGFPKARILGLVRRRKKNGMR